MSKNFNKRIETLFKQVFLFLNSEENNASQKSEKKEQLIKSFDKILTKAINDKINEAQQLSKEGKHKKAIYILKNKIELLGKNINSELKSTLREKLKELINNEYLKQINDKINEAKTMVEKGYQLKNLFNFDKVITKYNEASQLASEMNKSAKKDKKIRELRNLIQGVRIAKIKSSILDLGTKFVRLQIIEIAEECGIENDLIISTVKEMIDNKEIYAKYFESSKSVAFNQQANIDEIDKLMATYKEWEDKKVEKK